MVTVLSELELSDVDFGEFSEHLTEYSGTAADSATSTTVSASPKHEISSVEIMPADADDDPENGHQVEISEPTEVAVTVTSADGLRTRSYLVQVEPGEIASGETSEPSEEPTEPADEPEDQPEDEPEDEPVVEPQEALTPIPDLRIAARRLADGRTEFALQTRDPGSAWDERILPRQRFMPADADVHGWLTSSPAYGRRRRCGVGGLDCGAAARGRTNRFALQIRQVRVADGVRGERLLPRTRFLPADAEVDSWLTSSPINPEAG